MGVGNMRSAGCTETLNFLIIAICRDYFSRKAAIEQNRHTRRTLMEYEYLNRRIADAAREIVGNNYETYIKEIGESTGYARSGIPDISETGYKRTKREVKINIARKLHLID